MNKILFFLLINNKVLKNNIFSNVKYIHNSLNVKSYKWKQLLDKPRLLASYSYIDYIIQYFNRFKFNFSTSSIDEREHIKSIILSSVFANNISILQLVENELRQLINDNSNNNYIKIKIFKDNYYNSYYFKYDTNETKHLLYYSVKLNLTNIIKYLFDLDNKYSLDFNYKEVFKVSPHSGNLEVVKTIYHRCLEKGITLDCVGLDNIGSYWQWLTISGNTDILEWSFDFIEQSPAFGINYSKLITGAINSNNIEILSHMAKNNRYLKMIEENLSMKEKVSLVNHAYHKGYLQIIQCLILSYSAPISFTLTHQLPTNSLETIKWIHQVNPNRFSSISREYMAQLVICGNLEIIEWLHCNQYIPNNSSPLYILNDHAAKFNHLNILIWLRNNRSHEYCTTAAMDDAASTGNIKLVQWLHSNRTEGCTYFAMKNACLSGNLEMVKWFHNNRTECGPPQLMDSVDNVEILKFIHENRTEGYTITNSIWNSILKSNILKLKWLLEITKNPYLIDLPSYIQYIKIEYNSKFFNFFKQFLELIPRDDILEKQSSLKNKLFAEDPIFQNILNSYLYE